MSSPPQSPPLLEDGAQNRRWWWVLAVLAVGAWVLRVLPFFNRHGAFGYPVDYDEGVYFSASALLFRGELPYRDFVFVHPPGALLLWAPALPTTLTWRSVRQEGRRSLPAPPQVPGVRRCAPLASVPPPMTRG